MANASTGRRVGAILAWVATAIGLLVAGASAALGAVWWFVLLVTLGALGVGLAAQQHYRRRAQGWLQLLWLSALALLVASIISGFSVGLFLLPAALCALIAAWLAGSRA
ncbi:MAG: hypothetical protein ACYC4L_20940 [Chloroflexota bacterium]